MALNWTDEESALIAEAEAFARETFSGSKGRKGLNVAAREAHAIQMRRTRTPEASGLSSCLRPVVTAVSVRCAPRTDTARRRALAA